MILIKDNAGTVAASGVSLYAISKQDNVLADTARHMLHDGIAAEGKNELDLSMGDYEALFADMVKALGYHIEETDK